ncbi:MAG: chemotaxis protein CheX [Planctomycetaceae bacterium]|jgi:chemotaxis protein CheX|nr:chemotaxis protein CheX [Planctomycetaceae bacterium]
MFDSPHISSAANSTKQPIRVEFVNPFIIAVSKTLETMINCKVVREAPQLKKERTMLYPVSGIIGLTGAVVGTVVLTMSESLALKSASIMLQDECKEFNADVFDAVGELTNMIAGNAKAQLEEYKLRLSLPNVIHGDNTELLFPEESQPISIPFQTDYGPMAVEIGFTATKEAL